jgi:hypothetical protein
MDHPEIDFDALFFDFLDDLDVTEGSPFDNDPDAFELDGDLITLLQSDEFEEAIIDEIIESSNDGIEECASNASAVSDAIGEDDNKKREAAIADEATYDLVTVAPKQKKSRQIPCGRRRGIPKVADFPSELAAAFNTGSVDEITDVIASYAVPDCIFRAFHLDRDYVGRRYIVELMKYLLRKSSDIVEIVKKVRIENRSSMTYTAYTSWTSLPFLGKPPLCEDGSSECISLLSKMDLSTLSAEDIKDLADREQKLIDANQKVQIVGKAEMSLRLNRHNQITQFTVLSFKILSFDSIPEDLKRATSIGT